jgi:hypothetical protein
VRAVSFNCSYQIRYQIKAPLQRNINAAPGFLDPVFKFDEPIIGSNEPGNCDKKKENKKNYYGFHNNSFSKGSFGK